jgi:ketosteroid isomerase-like protein
MELLAMIRFARGTSILFAASALALMLPTAAMAATSATTSVAVKTSGPAADISAIRAVGLKWRELYAAGRYAEIPELYTVDTMVMPRGRARIEGREQMRRAIGGLAAGRKVEITLHEREIHAFGNMGWYVGDFVVTYSPTTVGAAPVTEYGRSMILYRRDNDGRWRVHRDIDSPAPHLAAVAAPAPAAPLSGMAEAVPSLWNPASRTEATVCDRLSSSRYDRTRLAPPVARENIDVPATIAQCEADLAKLPSDPRIHFQLGRLYGYVGDKEKTLMHRKAAAAAGNHNAIFLLGYLDWTAAKDDAARCAAARTMKLAADRGNYSGQITYSSFYLEGKLAACADAATRDEVTAYLAAARPVVDGFFETRFADHLIEAMADPSTEKMARARMISQMQGIWAGTFRRYDPQGSLVETLPSEIHVRFPEDGKPADYHQTNILKLADGKKQRLETYGKWDGDTLRFSSARVEGWFKALEDDASGLNSVLHMTFKDGSGLTVSEIITLSPDGKNRMRAAQYIVGGKIVRRTLIDESRS